ncbi:hypothetical protein F5B20DRAFT_594494 [Whalleya microplaca]|nr:hypothetical protein F5B20DRAFT_594494 [Whalleya microplaca]
MAYRQFFGQSARNAAQRRGYPRSNASSQGRGGVALPPNFRCVIGGEWLTPSEFSPKELDKWFRAKKSVNDGVTPENIALTCKKHSEPTHLQEVFCHGACSSWKEKKHFSKNQLKDHEPRCTACVDWDLRAGTEGAGPPPNTEPYEHEKFGRITFTSDKPVHDVASLVPSTASSTDNTQYTSGYLANQDEPFDEEEFRNAFNEALGGTTFHDVNAGFGNSRDQGNGAGGLWTEGIGNRGQALALPGVNMPTNGGMSLTSSFAGNTNRPLSNAEFESADDKRGLGFGKTTAPSENSRNTSVTTPTQPSSNTKAFIKPQLRPSMPSGATTQVPSPANAVGYVPPHLRHLQSSNPRGQGRTASSSTILNGSRAGARNPTTTSATTSEFGLPNLRSNTFGARDAAVPPPSSKQRMSTKKVPSTSQPGPNDPWVKVDNRKIFHDPLLFGDHPPEYHLYDSSSDEM